MDSVIHFVGVVLAYLFMLLIVIAGIGGVIAFYQYNKKTFDDWDHKDLP